jgi:hypothetical protein
MTLGILRVSPIGQGISGYQQVLSGLSVIVFHCKRVHCVLEKLVSINVNEGMVSPPMFVDNVSDLHLPPGESKQPRIPLSRAIAGVSEGAS